jgi:single-stranded-DNA-specific exonuclease
MRIVERSYSPAAAQALVEQGVPPLLARVWAARGIAHKSDAHPGHEQLLPYSRLSGAQEMASLLAEAIDRRTPLLIVADYDADGATACAIGVRALRAFGADVRFLVPNRADHGYGLSAAIAEVACTQGPRPGYLITVDNGISSHAGVAKAAEFGVPVLVTDHHLPGETLPAARVIVNPNQRGCSFESKALAGCGVMYYVMWALEDELRRRARAPVAHGFEVSSLLPLVAVGTVADVVPLDRNNRALVACGLRRIRRGHSFAGLDALALASDASPRNLTTADIGFGVGPRINAAGRLQTMDVGVECLLCDDPPRAQTLAEQLDQINGARKDIESEMVEQAIQQLLAHARPERSGVALYAERWHPGVVGVVAGRIKEALWRPTFVLAAGKDGLLKGSGRSLPGLHLRDALDLVNTRCPGLLLAYGGHAMAAGVTLAPGGFDAFSEAFEAVCAQFLSADDLRQEVHTDGALPAAEMSLENAQMLEKSVWGQAFASPAFYGEFNVREARLIGQGKHLRLVLEHEGHRFNAVKFRCQTPPGSARVRMVYKLAVNTFADRPSLQLVVEHLQDA